MTSVAFQSNLRKQFRKLPKFLKFVKIIQFYSILFNRVLIRDVVAAVALPLVVGISIGVATVDAVSATPGAKPNVAVTR